MCNNIQKIFSYICLFLGKYRLVVTGATGLVALCRSILELGGIFLHSPLLVRRVRPDDDAPPGAQFVVIDGNHRLYLFLNPYLYINIYLFLF